MSITADCDRDALLVLVEKDGPACHLGNDSCFEDVLFQSDERGDFTLEGLYDLLCQRNADRPEGSYTTYLFEKGLDKILKRWARNAPRSSSRARPRTRRRPSTSWRTWPTMHGAHGADGHHRGGRAG